MVNKRINIAQPSFLGNERKYVLDALDSGWVSSIGPYIENFEKSFAGYHGVKHAIATHNGTIALHLALSAAGITEGDEVIVPDLTFIATANSVRYCNATPILTDVSVESWNISPDAIAQSVSPQTKAIIPVHLYGNPAPMEEIMEIAKRNSLIVVEDCAEALGSLYKGRRVGTFGDISCFSFFGNKIITTGEGGMCITNNDDLAEKMRILRDHGMNRSKKYWYDNLGFNYRMTNIQAALGLAQLEQLETLLMVRDEIFTHYKEAIANHPAILLPESGANRSVNWMFTLRLKDFTAEQRDRIIARLKESGIDSRPVFYPISMMPFYNDQRFIKHPTPNTHRISEEGISLPTYVGLARDDIRYIVAELINSIETMAV